MTTGILRSASVAFATLACITLAACGGSDASEASGDMSTEADPLLDQTAYGFDDWDNDGDSELDADEFHEWAEGPILALYSVPLVLENAEGEMETTGALDAAVLLDGLYLAWDKNRDDALDRSEWARATSVVQSLTDTTDAWIEFDIDGNDAIELSEVEAKIEEDVVVAAIDANEDGTITDLEMNDWFFALFDTDESGTLDRDEWRLAELYLDVPTL